MIVGTAGHIDHGKTTLVHALTGVDTDRLPEEKRRGISIELGYAFLDLPQAPPDDAGVTRIGFIDVPGHERLVRTMIAGATGIDHALLLVAADDGPMPQTLEHLAVLSLLGLSHGALVITKVDRVDAARLAAVREEVTALVADSSLAGAPLFAVSAQSGQGIAELRQHLVDHARRAAGEQSRQHGFRLAIDRAFTLDGVGTIVTGTAHAGHLEVGDELALVPSRERLLARVRSLHAQNRPVRHAHAGQRCAIAVGGLPREAIERGQWLVSPQAASTGDRLDVWLELWRDEPRALRSGHTVQVHLGAASVVASVAILDDGGAAGNAAPAAPRDSLAPGARGLVQLVLREPIGAWRGDRVVLRDVSATRTLAGGTVLDPQAPARYRRTPQRLAELAALRLPTLPQRLHGLLEAAPHGVDLGRLAAAEGLADPASLPLPDGALTTRGGAGQWALGVQALRGTEQALLDGLREFHQRHPDEPGPDSGRLRRLALPRLPEPLWRALVERLIGSRQVTGRGAFLHLPEHGVQLSATEQRIAQKVAPRLQAGGFEGAWARDLARDTGEPEALMRTALARLAQRGELHQIVKDLYYAPQTVHALAAIARRVADGAAGHEVRAAAFRDGTQLGRKRAIQILEYFDRVGMLRRVGDVHKLRTDTSLFTD